MISIPYIWTEDNLRLQGVHYESPSKDICVLFVHGMAGNAIEDEFAHDVGKILCANGIGFLLGHNRGYNHINDIPTKTIENGGYKTVKIGVTYERFAESAQDIRGWINYIKEQRYKKIILMGHSLGTQKVVYYIHKNKIENLIGVVLCSPGDMVGLVKKPGYQNNYEELVKEAQHNVENGDPKKLLSTLIWNSYSLSSQTFLDLFTENGPADILPIFRNPPRFEELESITIPILETLAEHDDIVIRSLEEDFELMKLKAINASSFTTKIIPNTNHTYDNQGKTLGNEIYNWINRELAKN